MINFRVRIHNGIGFSGGIWKDEEKLFWNNERGGCCFGQKKQGIRFAVEAVEMIGYDLGFICLTYT